MRRVRGKAGLANGVRWSIARRWTRRPDPDSDGTAWGQRKMTGQHLTGKPPRP